MKTHKLLAGLVVVLMLGTSCKEFLDVNVNPDAPSDSQMTEALYLPGVLTLSSYLGLEQGNYFTSFWMLQNTKMGTSPGGPEHFVITPADFDNTWTLYDNSIQNATFLRDLAAKNKNFWYEGVAEVILAHQFSLLTDLFGDIPYSEAVKYASGITQPKFDSQADIYAGLIATLDKAIANLNTEKGTQKSIGADDYIFKGDREKWLKFAHSLKARLYLRMVYVDPANAQKSLDEVSKGIVTSSDNALFAYDTGAKTSNFWYQYSQNWTNFGNLYPSKYFVDVMNSLNDPRRDKLFTQTFDANGNPLGVYVGIVSGIPIDAYKEKTDFAKDNADALVSHFKLVLVAPERPAQFMSNVEMAFVKAEALLLNKSAVGDVQVALNAAITADMTSLGVAASDIATYLAKNEVNLSLATTDEARQRIIITQKYLALFMENSESYNDWRRTGYPAFTEANWSDCMTFASGVHRTAPVRFMYPSTAIQRNVNTPANVDSWTAKVWWDKKNKSTLAK
jgi:hypothetical protein